MDTLVDIARFRENAEAELVRGYLESVGIYAVVNDSLSNQLLGGYIDMCGAVLSVMKKELPQARKAMEEGGFAKYLM